MALSHGVTGETFSLQSSPSIPFFSSVMPTWQWASIRPGITRQPDASMISVLPVSGTSILSATAVIFPFSTRTLPLGITFPVMGSTRPFCISSLPSISAQPVQRIYRLSVFGQLEINIAAFHAVIFGRLRHLSDNFPGGYHITLGYGKICQLSVGKLIAVARFIMTAVPISGSS